jgi:hypothetical protein
MNSFDIKINEALDNVIDKHWSVWVDDGNMSHPYDRVIVAANNEKAAAIAAAAELKIDLTDQLYDDYSFYPEVFEYRDGPEPKPGKLSDKDQWGHDVGPPRIRYWNMRKWLRPSDLTKSS